MDKRTSLLQVKGLRNCYGDNEVFHDVSLTINSGEFVALVGESGGGKSTLLRLIAGLEEPTSGEIENWGDPLHGFNKLTRMMFQDDRLLPWLTVRENISFGSRRKKDRERAEQLLERVQLSAYADAYPKELSGGQRQRIALARALMARPHLLLLDEPLGALDALTRVKMQRLVSEIVTENNMATILVTHDVSEAVKMADTVIVVKDGRFDYRVPGLRNSSDGAAIMQLTEQIQDYILAESEGVVYEETT